VDRPAARHQRSGAASDEADFEDVYRTHVGFVWRVLRSLGVPEAGLEDASHEVFLVLHRRWEDWDRRCAMTTWLYGIAAGVARNERRGRKRAERKLALVRETNTSAADSGTRSDPGRQLDRKQAAAWVERFMEQLDPDKRDLFFLCEIEEMSVADAARCLQLNPNTAATRLRRARAVFARWVIELQETLS
jgi:RNA polymerase sigma-70 factor, ECF subfamily